MNNYEVTLFDYQEMKNQTVKLSARSAEEAGQKAMTLGRGVVSRVIPIIV